MRAHAIGQIAHAEEKRHDTPAGKDLTPGQLDALETRGALIGKHCAGQVAEKGERTVSYDLPPRQR